MKSDTIFRYFIVRLISPTAIVVLPLAFCGASLALVAPVLFKLFRKCRLEEITPEWLENFSPSTYYPMQGLLADEDFSFLSRQPGFDFSLYRKLRRERLHIFRQYLRRLIIDFNRLHASARVLVAHGHDDGSHLLVNLIWLKLRFSGAVFQAEASYLMCRAGLGSLAAQALILRLEEMNAQLTAISKLGSQFA